MRITQISYKRLVSFRDEEGRPANETLGATAQVDPAWETPEECKDKLIELVELELNERGTLRESSKALRVRVDSLENQIEYLQHRHAQIIAAVEEVLALHEKEIYVDADVWGDDIPF